MFEGGFKGVFHGFNEFFSIKALIYVAGYANAANNKWRLLNFICGEAKVAVCISGKNKIAHAGDCEAASVWRRNVRCRLRWEFDFYIWCHKDRCHVLSQRTI